MSRPRLSYPAGVKTCAICGEQKKLSEFGVREGVKTHKVRSNCRHCERAYGRRADQTWVGWAKTTRANAKKRAIARGVPFELSQRDIISLIPANMTCPVFGIPLIRSAKNSSPNSPSLDEKIPGLGYTIENARVISNRANTFKSSMTIKDIEALWRYMNE